MAMSKSSKTRKAKSVELVCKYVPAGSRILEISCGSGEVLDALQQQGYRVKGTNFTKYEGVIANLDIDNGIDILSELPYEDSSFDAVLLLDVIQHLSNHDHALSELARVCSDNGHVIVMTQNTTRLASRLHFFLTGFVKAKRAFIGFDVPREYAFAFHNYPPHLPTFLYQLRSHSLQLVEFTAAVYKFKSFLLYPLLFPITWLATTYKIHCCEKYLKKTSAAKELQQTMTSVSALCGEFWFTVSRKDQNVPDLQTKLPTWSQKWKSAKAE